MTKNKEKAIPKWFKGEVYTEGDTVTNQFSGADFELSPHELSMYDFIIGTQLMSSYILPFEIVSILLLAALIGAATLARKKNE